jgi:uncharacterized protein
MNCVTIFEFDRSRYRLSILMKCRFIFCMKTLSTFLLCLLLSLAHGQPKIPEHGGVWVHDEAHILSSQTKAMLESILQAERDSTSNQIAILIVPTLNGESIEDFSLRVAEKWQPGKKEKDNGVLLLISKDDRLMRIETGYGLEGALTDAIASRIIRNEIAPRFRTGDYDGGVHAGVMAIIQAIKGEYVNEDPAPRKRNSKGSPLATILILILIVILASRGRRGGGRGGNWSSGRGWMGPIGGFGGSGGGFGGGGGSFGGGGGFGGGGSSGSW